MTYGYAAQHLLLDVDRGVGDAAPEAEGKDPRCLQERATNCEWPAPAPESRMPHVPQEIREGCYGVCRVFGLRQ